MKVFKNQENSELLPDSTQFPPPPPPLAMRCLQPLSQAGQARHHLASSTHVDKSKSPWDSGKRPPHQSGFRVSKQVPPEARVWMNCPLGRCFSQCTYEHSPGCECFFSSWYSPGVGVGGLWFPANPEQQLLSLAHKETSGWWKHFALVSKAEMNV